MSLTFLISITIVSGSAMMVFFVLRLREVRAMDNEVFLNDLESSTPLLSSFHESAIVPFGKFCQKRITPIFYRVVEKLVSRIKIKVEKFGNWLARISDYFHGKNLPKSNGDKSEYWNDVNEFKNGLDKDDSED